MCWVIICPAESLAGCVCEVLQGYCIISNDSAFTRHVRACGFGRLPRITKSRPLCNALCILFSRLPFWSRSNLTGTGTNHAYGGRKSPRRVRDLRHPSAGGALAVTTSNVSTPAWISLWLGYYLRPSMVITGDKRLYSFAGPEATHQCWTFLCMKVSFLTDNSWLITPHEVSTFGLCTYH